jgi:hypothetical protein
LDRHNAPILFVGGLSGETLKIQTVSLTTGWNLISFQVGGSIIPQQFFQQPGNQRSPFNLELRFIQPQLG